MFDCLAGVVAVFILAFQKGRGMSELEDLKTHVNTMGTRIEIAEMEKNRDDLLFQLGQIYEDCDRLKNAVWRVFYKLKTDCPIAPDLPRGD